MFQFDYKRLYQNYVPQNVPDKMIGYSVGGVPVITYVLIGFTTAMLAAVQYLDNEESEIKESTPDTESEYESEEEESDDEEDEEEEEENEKE